MRDWSLSRRSVLRAGILASLPGVAGCSTRSGYNAIDVYIYNETEAELTATFRFLTCEQVGDEQQTIGVEPDLYSYSANTVIADSGMCSLEVSIPDGPSDTYEWEVGQKTLVITIKPDSIEFTRRSPTYTPER